MLNLSGSINVTEIDSKKKTVQENQDLSETGDELKICYIKK